MLSDLRKSKLAAVLLLFAVSLFGAAPLPAEERFPNVARLSFVSGGVTYSRGDDPDEWDDAVENVPLIAGDRIYAPADGRAELELSSGNFVRLAPRSYLTMVNLSDDIKQFYLGEGASSFNIRRLASDEDFEIDTPNVSVTFEGPGRYRVAVDENGDSRITVRRGRATVAANGRQIAVENSEIRIYGSDSPRYEIVGLPAPDALDRWVDERNDRFDRAYAEAYRYASEDIVGAADLNDYGRWEDIPEYGYAWTPAVMAAGWAPFSSGRWYWQDPWGWSWISNERWGWATSHYGRWMPYRSRWYWVPVRPRTRVVYAPACVEFVRVGDNIGWFPLHPRDRYTPWWRRDRRFDNNVLYVNRNYITVMNQNNFISARPVNRYLVRDAAILRQVRSARLTESQPIPNRSSLRIVSDNGVRRGFKPSAAVLNRTAVVRTAPPAPPRAFQDKLAEIQKNQGRAVEPARISAATANARGDRLRFRPAAETGRGEFGPRNPGAGPALQPVTEARGKKLATRSGGGSATAKTVETKNTPAAPLAPAQPSQATPNRVEPPRQAPQDIERQKQVQERQRQQQLQEQKQRDAERRRAQQQQDERKVPAQKQATPERQVEQRSREQQRLEELERRQAQQEADRKAQQTQQNRQEQQGREQLKQQQQQRQAQKQQEIEHRQQEERKAQALQQQQQQLDQIRREQQLGQQQQTQQRQAREQQLRQQQAQPLQRREEQERRPAPPPRRPQPQEQPAPQPQIQH